MLQNFPYLLFIISLHVADPLGTGFESLADWLFFSENKLGYIYIFQNI